MAKCWLLAVSVIAYVYFFSFFPRLSVILYDWFEYNLDKLKMAGGMCHLSPIQKMLSWLFLFAPWQLMASFHHVLEETMCRLFGQVGLFKPRWRLSSVGLLSLTPSIHLVGDQAGPIFIRLQFSIFSFVYAHKKRQVI